MLIFVKVKKYSYTLFSLLFKHWHALCREIFKHREWWKDIFNTPTIPRFRGMSQNPSTVSLLFKLLPKYKYVWWPTMRELKWKVFHSQQQTKPKLSSSELFSSLFGETWLASPMKTLKLKALWYKHEKMLIQFFEGISSKLLSLKVHNLDTIWQ